MKILCSQYPRPQLQKKLLRSASQSHHPKRILNSTEKARFIQTMKEKGAPVEEERNTPPDNIIEVSGEEAVTLTGMEGLGEAKNVTLEVQSDGRYRLTGFTPY